MAEKLPNGLVREILMPLLHVPNEMLHDVYYFSPFTLKPGRQPVSSVLEVCKQWYAVGAPLLYEVVVLRSGAQTYTFERTLRGGELGVIVKKFRVEGGYGTTMRTILDSSPNIKDFGIFSNLRVHDSEKGFANALDAMDPTTLTVLDLQRDTIRSHRPLRSTAKTIGLVLRNWKNLVGYNRNI